MSYLSFLIVCQLASPSEGGYRGLPKGGRTGLFNRSVIAMEGEQLQGKIGKNAGTAGAVLAPLVAEGVDMFH